jgi:phosphonate degradation associated HDIG domain protein
MAQHEISAENLIDYLMELIAKRGGEAYLGEAITQYEHMVQTAACAEADGASGELVAAALLHDIGHFENDLPYRFAEGIDNRHEEAAAAFLSPFFPPAVTEPIRLHVAAKRYLIAVDAAYFDRLSDASVETFRVQGGPMNQAEIAEFESNPYHREAVKVRRYDDDGKVAGLAIKPVEHYGPLLESLLIGK